MVSFQSYFQDFGYWQLKGRKRRNMVSEYMMP